MGNVQLMLVHFPYFIIRYVDNRFQYSESLHESEDHVSFKNKASSTLHESLHESEDHGSFQIKASTTLHGLNPSNNQWISWWMK